MGIFGTHTGSWGLPEFGITEKIGDKLGMGRNNQGGSILLPNIGAKSPQYGPTNQGQVLGAETNTPYNTPPSNTNTGFIAKSSPQQPTQQPTQQQNTPQAPDLYNEIGSVFDDLLGSFGGQQTDAESRIRSASDIQKQGINEQLGYGIDNLNQSRQNVKTEQANTLADLAQNFRDQARNIGNYIGSKGAGYSSGSDAASFALQKLFGKERAGVQRQAMQQLGDIDTQENTLKAKASEMLNGVETWANSQMADIASQFNQLRNSIGQMKGNLRAQAIETLYNRASEIQTMRQNYALAIQQQAQERLANLNNLKLELSGYGNFNPQDIVYSEYGFNPGSYVPENVDYFNPLALARSKKDEYQQ